jgi:hypothetical protein
VKAPGRGAVKGFLGVAAAIDRLAEAVEALKPD